VEAETADGIRIFLDLTPHGPKENPPAGQCIIRKPPRMDKARRTAHVYREFFEKE